MLGLAAWALKRPAAARHRPFGQPGGTCRRDGGKMVSFSAGGSAA